MCVTFLILVYLKCYCKLEWKPHRLFSSGYGLLSSQTGKGLSAVQNFSLHYSNLQEGVEDTYHIHYIVFSFTPPSAANLVNDLSFYVSQLLGHTCCVLPEETNQLQPPYQSQQSLLHLSRDWWNQPDPPYWLRGRPASLLAVGASQRGHGQHEQRSRGLCVCLCVCCKIPSHKVVSSSRTVCAEYCKQYLTSLQINKSSIDGVMSFSLFLKQHSWLWSAVFQNVVT